MKWLKIHWKSLINLVLIITLGSYVCLFAVKKVRNNQIYSKPQVQTKIYTVWHIETFEGGGKSRIQLLKTLARKVEKNNDGILFNIKQVQPEKLENELQFTTPDIFSFGFGVGRNVLPYLSVQENAYNVRDDLVESGCFSGKLYAIPYIVSGYAKIFRDTNLTEFIYGDNTYTDATMLNISATACESQYEAYKKFVNNKSVNLIGTARDVFRVQNLNNIGRINAEILPIEGYTDLIQYIASTKQDNIIKLFIEGLLSDEYQNKLTEYSLFSSLYTKIYSFGIYNDMENAIINSNFPNVFDE